MKIKGLISEDLINYKKPAMVIEFPKCNMKCGAEFCQNNPILSEPDIDISISNLVERYVNNPITEAIVFQGLEPFDSWNDLYELVLNLRIHTDDDIVIYTGYNKDEIQDKVLALQLHRNIVIKYGRYIPNQESHYDEVLGVNLASDNQYAERVS